MAFNTHTNTPTKTIPTYEGGNAIERKPKEELALTVLGSYLDADMFYEKVDDRVKRLAGLVDKVDDSFVEKLAVVARKEFNQRTPPTVLLALKTLKSGQPLNSTVENVMLRGDEVTEYLAAVKALSKKGKVIPSAKKTAEKGLQKLTERSALRYSGGSKAWSLADAMRIVHPNPLSDKQSAIFKFVVQKDKEGSLVKAWETLTPTEQSLLPVIASAVKGEDGAAVSWERAKSAGQSDWRVLVKDMGYMAMLRNLRNFITDVPSTESSFWNFVLEKIANKDEVLRSKQMPYRFYSAYKAVQGSSGAIRNKVLKAVSDALNYSAYNLPELGGRILVAVDTSSSMDSSVSNRDRSNPGQVEGENVTYSDIARVFGAATAVSQNATLVSFASTAKIVPTTHDVMSTLGGIRSGEVGHGTSPGMIARVADMKDYDTLIIFTDGQFSSSAMNETVFSNFKGKIYFVDLTGYKPGFVLGNKGNTRTIGGWSDATLRLLSLDSKGGIVEFIQNYKV